METVVSLFQLLKDPQQVNNAQNELEKIIDTDKENLLNVLSEIINSDIEDLVYNANQAVLMIRNILRSPNDGPFSLITPIWSNNFSATTRSNVTEAIIRGIVYDNESISNVSAYLISELIEINPVEEAGQIWPKIFRILEAYQNYGIYSVINIIKTINAMFLGNYFIKTFPEQAEEALENISSVCIQLLEAEGLQVQSYIQILIFLRRMTEKEQLGAKYDDDEFASNVISKILQIMQRVTDYQVHKEAYATLLGVIKKKYDSIDSVFEEIYGNISSDLGVDGEIDALRFDQCCNFLYDFLVYENLLDEDSKNYTSRIVVDSTTKLLVGLSRDEEDDGIRLSNDAVRIPLSAVKVIREYARMQDSEAVIDVLKRTFEAYIDSEDWRAVSSALYAYEIIVEAKGREELAYFTENFDHVGSKLTTINEIVCQQIMAFFSQNIDFISTVYYDGLIKLWDFTLPMLENSAYNAHLSCQILEKVAATSQFFERFPDTLSALFNTMNQSYIFNETLINDVVSALKAIFKEWKQDDAYPHIIEIIQSSLQKIQEASGVEMTESNRYRLQSGYLEIIYYILISYSHKQQIEEPMYECFKELKEMIVGGFTNSLSFNILYLMLKYLNADVKKEEEIPAYQIIIENICKSLQEEDASQMVFNCEIICDIFEKEELVYPIAFPILTYIIPNIRSAVSLQENILLALIGAAGTAINTLATMRYIEEFQPLFEEHGEEIGATELELYSMIEPFVTSPNDDYINEIAFAAFKIFRAYILLFPNVSDLKKVRIAFSKSIKILSDEVILKLKVYGALCNFITTALNSPNRNTLSTLMNEKIMYIIDDLKNTLTLSITMTDKTEKEDLVTKMDETLALFSEIYEASKKKDDDYMF